MKKQNYKQNLKLLYNSDLKNLIYSKTSRKYPANLFENQEKLKISESPYDLLSEVEIVISGGTTATIEAAIMNKKIILIGNTRVSL